MKAEYKLLIDALCVAVSRQRKELCLDVDWQAFLRLAREHGLSALVCDGIKKAEGVWDRIPLEAQNELNKAYMHAIFCESQQAYRKQQLLEKLTEQDVPHVFLKGAVLRENYPVPALRTMSDLDVLVYADDFGKIAKIAQDLGGKAISGDGNHRNFFFPGNVVVEFHPNLLHHATPVGTGINPGWQYVKEMPGPLKELTEEGFYLNTLCHFANHFVTGGVGVRFVLDVWVNRNLRKPQADRAFVEAELKRFDLLDFARSIESLADAWFGEGKMTPVLEELGEYILTSGSHGTIDRAVLNALSFSPGGSRFSALWKKAFYPRKELEERFPWCKGKTLLLPVAWFTRAFLAVMRHGDLIAHWSKGVSKFDKSQVMENKKKMKRFGIRQNGKK